MQLGEIISRGPPQVLPDPTDLAIADIALFMEFERELLLQSIKERVIMRENEAAAGAARRARAEQALTAFAETALREGLAKEEARFCSLCVCVACMD